MLENQNLQTSAKLITPEIESLLAEVREIYIQYKREVPGKRKPWPKSIIERVTELWQVGVSNGVISESSGIPAPTLYTWSQALKKQKPGFFPLSVIRRSRRKRKDAGLSRLPIEKAVIGKSSAKIITVTVIIDDGLRLEGVPIDEIQALIARLKKQ